MLHLKIRAKLCDEIPQIDFINLEVPHLPSGIASAGVDVDKAGGEAEAAFEAFKKAETSNTKLIETKKPSVSGELL